MAIPAIQSYAMPTDADLPQNKVGWLPEPRRAALLIHDMQRYFLAAFTAGESPVVELLANIKLLRQQCTALGIPVIYSAQPGGQTVEQRGLLQDFWGAGIPGDGEQQAIVDELTPGADDILLTKWRYSAFQRTDLLEVLRSQGRDQLLICGIYGHIGCLMTASEAFMQDVQPFLVADAIADFSLADHQMALNYAARRCAVTIATQQLLSELGSAQILRSEHELAETGAVSLTFQQLCADLADVLDEPDLALDEDTNLIDLGLDSIRIMSLIERWRRDGLEVSFMELIDRPTLGEWWQLLAARSSQVAAH